MPPSSKKHVLPSLEVEPAPINNASPAKKAHTSCIPKQTLTEASKAIVPTEAKAQQTRASKALATPANSVASTAVSTTSKGKRASKDTTSSSKTPASKNTAQAPAKSAKSAKSIEDNPKPAAGRGQKQKLEETEAQKEAARKKAKELDNAVELQLQTDIDSKTDSDIEHKVLSIIISDTDDPDNGGENLANTVGDQADKNSDVNEEPASTDSDNDHEETVKKLKAKLAQLEAKNTYSPKEKHLNPIASGLKSAFTTAPQTKTKGICAAAVTVTEGGGINEDDINDDGPTCGSSSKDNTADQARIFPKPGHKTKLVCNADHINTDVAKARNSRPAPSSSRAAPSVDSRQSTTPHSTIASKPPSCSTSRAREDGPSLGRAQASDLPAFTAERNKWRKGFVPTIYHFLYTSPEPFLNFVAKSTKFVQIVQGAVDIVYPNVTYSVRAQSEPIHQLAYARINERHGLIAKSGLTTVSNYIKKLPNKQEATEWLKWAHRINGPLYFSVPTPMTCTSRRGNANYVEPSGRLLSPFIVDMATNALKFCEGAVITRANASPLRLFAVILASLERAAKAILPDGSISEDLKEFSQPVWGAQVKIYWESLERVLAERRQEILGKCSPECAIEEADADDSILDQDRRDMFDFESPRKPS
ncbi:hypothetical protein FA15DRAFT_710310 [Coprinopsis marcescibilis]|uniref:Uncharacterized protein n=1 Tax=Coprinopsis marcescibilis TaxID=230819 RepID=A0A5C3KDB3_COPMA|nr:hypothetical protein FA15DRAFT_710310 [Coprinopsis marcescibilis]